MEEMRMILNEHLQTAFYIYLAVSAVVFIYLARTRPRDGSFKEDARKGPLAALWALAWPLTAVSYALGHLYRLIAEIRR